MVLESSGVSRRLRSEVQVSSEEVAHKFFITAKNEEFIEISSDVRLAKYPLFLEKFPNSKLCTPIKLGPC